MGKSMVVSVDVAEVMDNIARSSAYVARRLMTGDGAMWDNGRVTDGDSDVVKRSIATAWGAIKSLLCEYVEESHSSSENAVLSEETLQLQLSLPSNHRGAGAEGIGNQVHAYLVGMALSDWYKAVAPDEAAVFAAEAGIAAEEARKMIYKRERPTRE